MNTNLVVTSDNLDLMKSMSNLLDTLDNIEEEMNKISSDIKFIENLLKRVPISIRRTYENCGLLWDYEEKRLMASYNESEFKPLIEHKFAIRSKLHKYLTHFIQEINKELS